MDELRKVLNTVSGEASAARAYFHTWWALRNLALPEFHTTMNNHDFVDFFHVANVGTYNMIFVSLSKVFDRDERVAGFRRLREELQKEGLEELAAKLQNEIEAKKDLIQKILRIRNQSIAHNEHDFPRHQVYEINGVTPNQIREVIDTTCSLMNSIREELGDSIRISDSDRLESSTLNMLRQLRNGET